MPSETDTNEIIVKLTLIVITILQDNIAIINAAVELPLCPTNIQFLPQKLPMHCRMPAMKNFSFADIPGLNIFSKPPLPISMPGSAPASIPGTISGPMPGFPGVMPGFPGMMPPGIMPPGMMPPGMPIGAPGPMPMPMPFPGAKLPVIVMPFYAPDNNNNNVNNNNKHSKPQYSDRDTDTSSSDTDSDNSGDGWSSDDGWWKKKKHRSTRTHGKRDNKHIRKNHRRFNRKRHEDKRRRMKNVVTPILQYVTKDGYVIYQKKISQPEAKEWLNINKAEPQNNPARTETVDKTVTPPEEEDYDSFENDNESEDQEVNIRAKVNAKTIKRQNKNMVPSKLPSKKYKPKMNN